MNDKDFEIKLVIGIFLLFMTICIGTVSAEDSAMILTVDDSGGEDYTTIQEAVDNSISGNTVIYVYPGTYTENVVVDKSVVIMSESKNPDSTVVQANNPDDNVFRVTANDVTISGFKIIDGDNCGIYLEGVNECSISNNNLVNNLYAIELYSSNNNMLEDNLAKNNSVGFILDGIDGSNNNTIKDNIANLNNGGFGFGIIGNNNTLDNNTANKNNAFGISLGSSNKLINNTANSNTLAGIKVLGHDNLLINNSVENNSIGFLLRSNNTTLKNNIASINDRGILLKNANYNTLSNNNINLNNEDGISLNASKHNNLCNNSVLNNDDGINIFSSSNNKLENNVVLNNSWFGIGLHESTNILLTNNYASGNYYGIYLLGNNHNLNGNILTKNDYGIWNQFSDNNVLKNNIVNKSKKDGIVISFGDNNLIYNNHFNNTNNVRYVAYPEDTWNISKKQETNIVGGPFIGGNFWANPNGTGFSQNCEDMNNDGICDSSYYIGGDTYDHLPLSMYHGESPNVCRDLPEEARPGDTITVNLDITLDGADKTVIEETAPSGWTISNPTDDGTVIDDNTVSWINPGSAPDNQVSYDVTIPGDISDGFYNFTGQFDLTIGESGWQPIGGNYQIKVNDTDIIHREPNVCRDLPSRAYPGDTFTVNLDITQDGADKTVIEDNVPSGWTVSNPTDRGSVIDSNTVSWLNPGAAPDNQLSYEVTIPEDAESSMYNFTGQFDLTVGGVGLQPIDCDSQMEVIPYNPYDFNRNCMIELNEVNAAIDDYRIGQGTTLSEVNELIDMYRKGEPYC